MHELPLDELDKRTLNPDRGLKGFLSTLEKGKILLCFFLYFFWKQSKLLTLEVIKAASVSVKQVDADG